MTMNRRNFVITGAVAVAGAALLSAPAAEGEAKEGKMKKAVQFGMINEKGMSVMDKFKLAKELGFEGVEINSIPGMELGELLKAKEETGLGISEICDALHWKDVLSSPSEEMRARGVKALKDSLEIAKQVGSTSVLLVPGVVNKNCSYDECYSRSQAEIKKCLPDAERLGVKIAIENVWNGFLLSPLEMARYVDEFQSPWVGVHFDVGNIINFGWPEQWIRILNKRILKLHIKEYSRARRDKEGLWKGFDVKLGDGDNDWPSVVTALKEIGYTGWATAEVPGGDRVALKDISERMTKILGL